MSLLLFLMIIRPNISTWPYGTQRTIKINAAYGFGHIQSFQNMNDIVKQMEKEWPEMTGEFKRLQEEQYILFCHTQHDYGSGNISVGTQLETEEEVLLSLTGLWFRMNDKIQRLKNLLMTRRENAVEGEPMEDAFLDVSNYGIMATIVKNGKGAK